MIIILNMLGMEKEIDSYIANDGKSFSHKSLCDIHNEELDIENFLTEIFSTNIVSACNGGYRWKYSVSNYDSLLKFMDVIHDFFIKTSKGRIDISWHGKGCSIECPPADDMSDGEILYIYTEESYDRDANDFSINIICNRLEQQVKKIRESMFKICDIYKTSILDIADKI